MKYKPYKPKNFKRKIKYLINPPLGFFVDELKNISNLKKIIGENMYTMEFERANDSSGYCCWVCAINRQKTNSGLFFSPDVTVRYKDNLLHYIRPAALCRNCFAFHNPFYLLWLKQSEKITDRQYNYILWRGMKMCKENNVDPFFLSKSLYMISKGMDIDEINRYVSIYSSQYEYGDRPWRIKIFGNVEILDFNKGQDFQ